MSRLTRITSELREIVEDLDAARTDARDALELVRVAAEGERLFATAKALYAQRCAETGVWSTDREARVPAVTPAEWLADLSGSGIGAARDALAVTAAVHEGSITDTALRSGTLSLTAAREVTAAAEVGGESAERRVLSKATTEGLRSAKTEATRVRATAADAAARELRIHRQRAVRQWTTRDGEWNLHLAGPIALGAEIQACLAPYRDAAWDAASRQAPADRDGPDAIAFDGFLGMARAARDGVGRPVTTKPRGRAKTRDHVVVHVDATTLTAGRVRNGERCEIPGVGPVPVAHARDVLGGGDIGPAVLTILVEHGRDVRTMARPGRKVTSDLARLLTARDSACVVRGCERAVRLEGDHGHPVAEGGNSTAGNLRGMCHQHHRRKTAGWVLTELPDGTCTLEPPAATGRRAKPAAA